MLLLWAGLSVFYWMGNWQVSLFDRDEPRFAQPAREMIFSHSWKDWIVPTFNGEPFFHKPPLCYWQTAVADAVFGINEFSARFFSGLLTAATAVALAMFLTKRYSFAVGLTAAAMYSTSLIVIVEAKLATADATLGFLAVLAALSCWECFNGKASPFSKIVLWLAVGLAILCKGPAIFVVLVGLTAALLLLDRDRSWVSRTGFWWGLPLAIAVGLPWYVAAERIAGGGLVERFVAYDLLDRILTPLESHRGFPGFYLVTALIDTWPWSAFLAPLAGYVWKNRGDRNIKFLLAWLIGPTLILEFIATKMVHYWLVVLPAFSVLLALGMRFWIVDPEQRFSVRWKKYVFGVLAAVWTILGVVVLVGQKILFGRYVPPLVALALVLFLTALIVLFAWSRKSMASSFITVAVTTALIAVTVSVVALPALEEFKISRQLAMLMRSRGNAQSTYALIGWEEPATIYYLHTGEKDIQLASTQEFGTLMNQPDRVVGLSQSAYAEISPVNAAVSFSRVDGFDYTRGRRETAYVAWSMQQ